MVKTNHILGQLNNKYGVTHQSVLAYLTSLHSELKVVLLCTTVNSLHSGSGDVGVKILIYTLVQCSDILVGKLNQILPNVRLRLNFIPCKFNLKASSYATKCCAIDISGPHLFYFNVPQSA